MPEFSACYFCGTALDAPLAEYPVIPDVVHPAPDEQRKIVLCPTCRRKTGAVVETVLEAVDVLPGDEPIQDDAADANDGIAATAEENTDLDAEHLSGDEVQAEADDESDGEGGQSSESTTVDAGGFEFEGDEADDTSTATDGPSDGGQAGNDDGAEAESNVADATENDVGDAEQSSDTSAETAATAGEKSSTGQETSAEKTDAADEEPQMSALEYNKVMRLLQNREYPVDHEEFKVVATNAYEISEDEFDAVIEAAAKRDLIGLDGGQIVEP